MFRTTVGNTMTANRVVFLVETCNWIGAGLRQGWLLSDSPLSPASSPIPPYFSASLKKMAEFHNGKCTQFTQSMWHRIGNVEFYFCCSLNPDFVGLIQFLMIKSRFLLVKTISLLFSQQFRWFNPHLGWLNQLNPCFCWPHFICFCFRDMLVQSTL